MRLLPEQPFFAGPFGEKIFALESLSDPEALGDFSDQHDVPGMQPHCVRQKRIVLDVVAAGDRTGSARGTMHAAGFEFTHAFRVGMSAKADSLIVRIIFRTL